VSGDLVGTFGSATLPGQDNHYDTEPFGDEEPLPPSAVPPTTRGFYNEEFSPLNLEADCKFFATCTLPAMLTILVCVGCLWRTFVLREVTIVQF
jgi:hypothetical protein